MPLSPSCTAAQIGFADISRPPTWSFMFAATSIHEKSVSGEHSSLGNSRLNSGLSCDAVVTLVYRTVPPPTQPHPPAGFTAFAFYFLSNTFFTVLLILKKNIGFTDWIYVSIFEKNRILISSIVTLSNKHSMLSS